MKVFSMSQLYAVDVAKILTAKHAIISLTDPKSELPEFAPNESRIAVLGQHFYDIDFSKEIYQRDEKEIKRIYGYGLFTDEQAREIVLFVKQYMDNIKALIVHCDAGISRSSGVAAAILKATTGSDEQIFNDPKFIPNMFVYRKVLNAWHKEDES